MSRSNNFNILRKRRAGTIAAIEIDGSVVKILCVRGPRSQPPEERKLIYKNEMAPATAGPENDQDGTAPDTEDYRSRLIAETLEEETIKPDSWYAAIPSHLCFTKHVTFPSTDQRELDQMVQHHAATLLPLEENEIVYDYRILDQSDDGYSSVVLSLVQRNVVEGYLRVLNDGGIDPEFLTTSAGAVFSSYSGGGIRSENMSDTAPEHIRGNVLYLDVDFHHTTFLLAESGRLVYTRSLDLGAGALDKLGYPGLQIESWIEEFVNQVKTTIKTARSNGGTIDGICVSGARDLFSELERALKEAFGAPVSCLDSEFDMASAQSLLGLVNGSTDEKMNLLPPPVIDRRRSRKVRRSVLRTALLTVVLIAGLTQIFSNNINRRERYLDYLNTEIATTRGAASELAAKQGKIRLLNEHTGRGNSSLQVFTEVYRLVPRPIQLVQVIYESEKSLTLKGEARDISQVIDLTPVLENSELFDDVRVNYATRGQRSDGTVDFEISLGIR